MFDSLSDRLQDSLRKLSGRGKITEENIAESLREVRLALLEADVELSLARQFVDEVKTKALGANVLQGVDAGQQIVKIVQDELTKLLGGNSASLQLNAPGHILLCGLNGAGKTTTAGKLANWLKQDGRRPLLVALDLYRPAAIEQLATLGKQLDIPVFRPQPGEKDPVVAAKEALKWIQGQDGTVVIFDTAGRQEIDDQLVDELERLHKLIRPGETLLVADAATGQQSVDVAQRFHSRISLDGIVLTKLDGDARGGAALSMRSITGVPIKFSGTGEKIADFEVFHPERLAGRILGMGDVVSLVEKASEAIDEKRAERMAKRMLKAKFDFEDFLEQLRFMQNLGPLEGILKMLPGMGQLKNLNVEESKMKRIEAIILSMTVKERRRPEVLNGSRRKRIAAGSGTTLKDVNALLKQFSQMKQLMKGKGKMAQMMKQMGGMEGMMGGMGGGGKAPQMPNLGDLGGGGNMGGMNSDALMKMAKQLKGGKKGGGGFPF